MLIRIVKKETDFWNEEKKKKGQEEAEEQEEKMPVLTTRVRVTVRFFRPPDGDVNYEEKCV